MSRFKVRASLDNITRTVEFERQKYDLASVKDKTGKAFGQGQVNIRYTSATGESYYITSDQQLHKAIKDAEKSGAKFIELKVFRDSVGGSAPAQAASRPAQAPSQPSHAAPQSSAPAARSAPAAQAAGVLTSYKLYADHGSSNDRVIVDPQQTSDSFIFSVKPSKYDTDVDVQLNGQALTFLTTHTVQEGNSVKTIKGTQGISLPFAPSADQVQVIGQQIKIFFPK